MSDKAYITPKVLRWARESARMSMEIAASKVHITPERLNEWEEGIIQPTIKQAEILAEEILQIADDASGDIKYDKDGNESLNGEFVARSRLRIDTRKWLAAKLLPKAYGDKKQVEETNPADTLNKIQALVADLNKTNVSDI